MEANETTHLLVDPTLITTAKARDPNNSDTRLDIDYFPPHYGVVGSLQLQNKVLLILTATLAIILFVIIIDMSITALEVSVPIPPFKNLDYNCTN